MKLLLDFLPIFIFFIAFKFGGIYYATAAFMAASALQIGIHWLRYRKVERMHLVTFILGIVLGGATLMLQNELFIKWKPTVIYWVLAIACIGSQLISSKPMVQQLLETNVSLPAQIWKRLNLTWTLFFTFLGVANLYVAYTYSTDIWVNFKLFGLLAMTVVFIIIQALYMSYHMNKPQEHS